MTLTAYNKHPGGETDSIRVRQLPLWNGVGLLPPAVWLAHILSRDDGSLFWLYELCQVHERAHIGGVFIGDVREFQAFWPVPCCKQPVGPKRASREAHHEKFDQGLDV